MQPSSLLETAIEYLKGVGPLKGKLLQKEFGIHTFGDLLLHFPYRYLDTAGLQSISMLSPQYDWVYLQGVISNLREEGGGYKKRLVATFSDASGQMELIWFQGATWLKKSIQVGAVYRVFGKLTYFNGQPTISHPEIERLEENASAATGRLRPVYPSSESLRGKGLNNHTFAKLLQELFRRIRPEDLPENLPQELVRQYGLSPRYIAFRDIHFPADEPAKNKAAHRLKWEELFYTHLRLGTLKVKHQDQPGFRFPNVGSFFNDFFSRHLPFQLTAAQKKVVREIRRDTLSGQQMNRLLQGDVGSGKTIVAVLSMLLALDNGFQASLMAPTEILAQQHYSSIVRLLRPLDIPVAILTGSVKGKQRKQILNGIAEGVYPIVVGTHALVEEAVNFQNLGLAIIDEQHRFGVSQRAKLWMKNKLPPHILVMTATPIPRTLAMTVYGDLEVSVIDELPPGRKPVQTLHRTENFRPKVMQFLKWQIAEGRQIYIVYPLIEESEKLDYESLLAGIEQVSSWFPPPDYRIAMVHGRQNPEERTNNMDRFVKGQAQILVATTVIEVGVDVANATVMVIESAERFGLSQLHQLRGRVGRGSEKSYCILLTGHELSKESRQRMQIMVQTNNGFLIAEEDLKMRGPGDLYGTRQSGALQFKIADILTDGAIMEETKIAASRILREDPRLEQRCHQLLKPGLNTKNRKKNVLSWSKIS